MTNNEICPLCQSKTIHVFGQGWDWDTVLCPTKGCHYERELDVMTVIENGVTTVFDKPKD